MMDLRVVTYQPGATSFEIVDAVPEITWYDRQGQTPMLTLSWLEGATGWKNLSGMVEVAAQYHDGNGWVEPRNGRFTIGQVSWERLTDTTRTRRFTNPGYVAQLSAYSVDTRLGSIDTDGKRQFNSVTPGALLVTLISEGKTAGYFPHLQVGFTTTHDSNGDPWPMVYNRAYGSGVKLSGVLQNLFDTGAVEYWMHGRVLHAAPTVGTDYTTGTDPVWIRDLIANSSPEEEDWTNLINKVVVNGEAGLRWEFTNPEANTVWGNRVETISAGGVNDEGTARVLADKILLAGQDAKRSYTREWVETVLPVMPGRDLVCGDWVKVDTALGSGARMRIASQGLRKTSTGALTGFVTVGTVTDDLLTKLAKRTVGIEGGSGVVSNGKPAPVTPVAATPKPPTGTPTVTPTAYLDSEGRQQGLLTVSWPPVVESTLGDLIEIDHYIVGWRINLADKGWAPLTSSSSPVGVSPVPVGQPLTVVVKAVAGNGNESAWSTAWVGVVPTDATPPAQPKAPVLATRLGVVTVSWDGKNASNGSMPADFDRCEIERESVGLIGSLLRAGDFVTVPNQKPGVAQRYRLIAVDRVGNRSTPSVWASITTAKLVSGDLDPGISTSIAAAQAKADTAFANAGIAQTAANSAQTTANSASTAASAAQTTATSASTAASSAQSSANSAATAAATAQTAASNANQAAIKKLTRSHLPPSTTVGFPTDAVWWRYGDATLTGPVIQQFTLGATGWVETPIGDQAIANLSVDKLVATGQAVISDAVINTVTSNSAFLRNLIANKVVVAGDPTNQVGTTMIEAGAITTDTIAANAVTGNKIQAGTIQTEHLSARSITADKIDLKAIDRTKLDDGITGTLSNADAWAARTVLEPGRITLKSTTGTGATDAQMSLTPTRLSMEAGGSEVAYIDSTEQTLAITRARISDSVQVGRHMIESFNSEITMVRWVG